MPRLAIPVTAVTPAGVLVPAATAGSAADDHFFANIAGRTILFAKNTHATNAQNLTIITAYQLNDGSTLLNVDDRVKSVAALTEQVFGVFSDAVYGQIADALRVYVDITESTWEFRCYSI